MLYFAGSIIFTCYLTLSFKVLERFHFNSFHAIAFNYITGVVTGSIVEGSFPVYRSTTQLSWLPWALIMGATFISLCLIVIVSHRLPFRSVIAGIAIGVPNYFSIWCLLKVLKAHTGSSAVMFPLNNRGLYCSVRWSPGWHSKKD